MKWILFILFTACLFAGCSGGRDSRERQEELCRLLFEPGKDVAYCDSVVELARVLPADAHLEVLLEAVRNDNGGNFPEKTAIWLDEAIRISPEARRVEVEMEKKVRDYRGKRADMDQNTRDGFRQEFCRLEQEYRLSSRQRALYFYNRGMIYRESDLLDAWMCMKEARKLLRGKNQPILEVRVLENFSYIMMLAGDYETSLSFWKEAYCLREREHFPLNKWGYLCGLAERFSELQDWPEVLDCWRELLKDSRNLSDEAGERLAMFQMAKIYSLMDSLPEALDVFRRIEAMDTLPRTKVWVDMAEVFERQGLRDSVRYCYAKVVEAREKQKRSRVLGNDIPAYSGYARFLWEEGEREEAVRLLQQVAAVIPHYSGQNDPVGGVYLYPYLQALLQLSDYYREEGRFRPATELLFRRDSLLLKYNESAIWYKKQKVADQFRNRELRAQVELQEVLLADRRRTLVAVSLVSVLLAGGLVLLWRLYRTKRRRLDEIYLKQKEVERLERQVSAAVSVSDNPETALFRRLEKLVIEQQLFRKPDLSLDDVCPLVGSNRSYVSACVNKGAGMNFSAWMNKIRVDYVLADISRDLCYLPDLYSAAGFASQTSFYRNFKLVTQMTPKQYIEREKRKNKV